MMRVVDGLRPTGPRVYCCGALMSPADAAIVLPQPWADRDGPLSALEGLPRLV